MASRCTCVLGYAAAAAAAVNDISDDAGVGRWAETNRDQLRQHNSSLEFKLHRLRFIEFIERGACGQTDAVQYAKNFAPFAAAHSKGLPTFPPLSLLHLTSY